MPEAFSAVLETDIAAFQLFENLRTLDLSNNELMDLAGFDFSVFKKLEGINLYQNQLKEIPQQLYQIITLEEINLGSNEIKEIAEGINNWKYLMILKLHHNQIEQLNANWGLKNLRRLRLDGNQIAEIPEALFTGSPQITYCNLNNNQLEKLPKSLYSSKIKHLDIGSKLKISKI